MLKKVTIVIICFTAVVGLASSVSAQPNIGDAQDILSRSVNDTGQFTGNLTEGSGLLVERLLQGVGIIFLMLMVFAGIMWMTARENEQQAERAKGTFTTASIGMIITVGAYAITVFVVQGIIQGAQDDGGGFGPQACCQDKTNGGWACRLTTQSQCIEVGTTCEPGDDFCALRDVRFDEGVQETNPCIQICNELNDQINDQQTANNV